MTKDPICGMTVGEAEAIHAERDGRTYYFCSEHCRKKFLDGGQSRVDRGSPDKATRECCQSVVDAGDAWGSHRSSPRSR